MGRIGHLVLLLVLPMECVLWTNNHMLFLLLVTYYSSITLGWPEISVDSDEERPISTASLIAEVDRETMENSRNEEAKISWPEFVGMNGEKVKKQLEATVPGMEIFVIPEGSVVTFDLLLNRIRIFVDRNGNVARPPCVG